ncbi:MAG: apolipoprotein N-acyltransferase [Bdellovibrionota bacterium]
MSVAQRIKGAFSIHTKLAALSALAFALASRYGESHSAVVLTVTVAAALNVIALRSKHLVFDLLFFGLVFHAAAFSWLPQTLSFFGGFPTPVSYVLFALFCILSSAQLMLVAWLCRRLQRSPLDALGLALPLAWWAGEFFVPRLFPWSLVHPLVSWKLFSGLAAFVGVYPLSALILWWMRVFLMLVPSRAGGVVRSRLELGGLAASVLTASFVSAYGASALESSLSNAQSIAVGLIQGNLSATQKGDVRLLTPNLEVYRALSRQAIAAGAQLLIWPESVMNAWTPEDIERVRNTRIDPFPESTVPLLYGGLSFRKLSQEELDRNPPMSEDMLYYRFNSAFGIGGDGKVLGRYHKRVLMPFGEYLPLAKTFPMIKSISPHTGDFSVGDRVDPITFPLPDGAGSYRVANLICYEDLVPSLTREGVRLGANVLVNLTNDAWYGETAAPYQHHLLASWRAIESGRFLIRATNTGFSGIVDPRGTTVAGLPIFDQGTLVRQVSLLSHETLYTKVGDVFSWLLGALSLVAGFRVRKDARPAE